MPSVPRAGAAPCGPAVAQDYRRDSDWKLCGLRRDCSVSFSAPSSKELLCLVLFSCGFQKVAGDLGSIFDSECFRCIYYKESQCSDLLTDLSEPSEPFHTSGGTHFSRGWGDRWFGFHVNVANYFACTFYTVATHWKLRPDTTAAAAWRLAARACEYMFAACRFLFPLLPQPCCMTTEGLRSAAESLSAPGTVPCTCST